MDITKLGRNLGWFGQDIHCFFGGELFGTFDREIGGAADGLAIDKNLHEVLSVVAVAGFCNNLKFKAFLFFLGPFQQSAFVIDFGGLDFFDIVMVPDDIFDHDFPGELVAFIDIEGTDKCFEGIAHHGAVVAEILLLCFDKSFEAEFLGEFVELDPAHHFGAHFGKESFVFEGEKLKKEIGYDSAKDGIAEVFEAFVANFGVIV